MGAKSTGGKGKLSAAKAREAAARAQRHAEAHRNGLLISGEAAEAKDGVLPPGATHEIVDAEAEKEAVAKLVRRRFSAF